MVRLRLPHTLLLSFLFVVFGCQEMTTPTGPDGDAGAVTDGAGLEAEGEGENADQSSDGSADPEGESSGESEGVTASAATPGSILAQIRALYNGHPDQAPALEMFEVVVRLIPIGTPQAVQDEALTFIDFVLTSNQAGNLVDPNGSAPPTLQQALSQLIADVYTLAGVSAPPPPPAAFDPDGAAMVLMSGGGQVVNGTQFAGADFSPGTFADPTLVSIVRLPNPTVKGQGPLPTNFPQYPLFYEISASSAAVQQFVTAICVLDDPPEPLGAPAALAQHLRIAHPDPLNRQTIKVLAVAPSPFLACTGANGGPSVNAPGGLGGLATSFSPFGAVVPGVSVFNELKTIVLGLTQTPLSDALVEQLEQVIRFVRNGDVGGAQAEALSIIDRIRNEQAAGRLLDPNGSAPPTIDEAITNLVAQLSAFVNLPVTTPPPPPPSPSVQELLFNRGDGAGDNDIHITESTGANQRDLSGTGDFDVQAKWSPDGSRIVFMRQSPHSTPGDIWVMNADGSGKVNITNSPEKEERPAWDPTGTKIVFTRIEASNDARVWTINDDGSGQVPVTPAGGDREAFAEFSPDGSKISYVRFQQVGGTALDVVDPDGSNPVVLLPSQNGESVSFRDWSPDGSRIAASYRQRVNGLPVSQIVTVGVDGSGGITPLTNFPFATSSVATFPDWSPDGTKITFGAAEVWVMNADGSGQVMIAAGPDDPSWSPDGTLIAAYMRLTGGIVVMNADGSGQQTISPVGDTPEWRP